MKEWFEAVLNSLSDGIVVTDNEGSILKMNLSTASLTGWKQNEMIGKSVQDIFQIVNPKTGRSIRNPVQYVIRKGFPFMLVDCSMIITKKGEKIPIHGECNPFYSDCGEMKGVVITFQSVAIQDQPSLQKKSDTKSMDSMESSETLKNQMAYCEKTNKELIQECDLLYTLMDNVPDFISFKDRESRFIKVNRAEAKRLSLSDPEQAVGKTEFHFLPKEYAQLTYEAEQAIIQSGKSMINYEVCMNNGNGKKRYFLSTKVPIKNALNQVAGLVDITRDITERKHFEKALKQTMEKMQQMMTKLKQSNAELQQFAFISSHDLQEPLRIVSIYVQMLADRYKGKLDADADMYVNYAVEGVKRMQNLIRDLLLYSQIGSTNDSFKPVGISKVIDRVLQNLEEVVIERSARITYDNTLPVIIADARQMILLFENLIDNALKFNQKKVPRIHVCAKKSNGEWIFSVRDNGIGIELQYFDSIFKPFYRVHHTVEYAGTGIGLSVCRKIIDHHSGNIWVESKPRKGSKFYFSIPIMGE